MIADTHARNGKEAEESAHELAEWLSTAQPPATVVKGMIVRIHERLLEVTMQKRP